MFRPMVCAVVVCCAFCVSTHVPLNSRMVTIRNNGTCVLNIQCAIEMMCANGNTNGYQLSPGEQMALDADHRSVVDISAECPCIYDKPQPRKSRRRRSGATD